MMMITDAEVWTTACRYDRLIPGLGVGVLLDDGSQAALFRVDDDSTDGSTDGSVYAIGNIDPFFRAAVLSRGIVADIDGRLAVASPLKKQHFALDDGICLEDPRFAVPVYPVRVTTDGDVEIGRPVALSAAA